jgi:outer membrane protein insertion porin family
MQPIKNNRFNYSLTNLRYRQWLFVVLYIFLSSCTGTKYLKPGESFYDGAEIHFKTQTRIGRKKILRKELETYITPKPNSKLLGMRPGVWLYFIVGEPKKKKGFKSFVKRKLGQPPVLIKDATPERTAKLLSGYLYNEGYFKSKTTATVKTKRKASEVDYEVTLYPPYHLREIQYPKGRDSTYAVIMKTLHEKALLKTGQRYQLDMMQAEQERIEKEVENFGFYYFDDRYLIFEADSTEGVKQVDLRLRLEPGIPARAKRIYKLGDINVFPNYTLSNDSLRVKGDTIRFDGYTYIDDKKAFRPNVITRVINLHKGDIYTREAQDLTLSHLMGMGTFKFVNIKFSEVNADSAFLHTDVLLTPLKKKSLRAEVQAVSKSNNFVGPGVSLVFTNRNFLRGAELFQLKLNSAYEVQVSRKVNQTLNSFELGAEASLAVPRFISPIPIDYSSRKYLPKTEFKLGFNLQNRVGYFRLNSFHLGYGYTWKETLSRMHELYPIDINFVKTDKTSEDFSLLLKNNRVLANSFEDQFIVGTHYSYTVNTQLTDNVVDKFKVQRVRPHNFYFNGNIDIAGNLLRAIQRQVHKDDAGPYEILGSPYSQYLKTEVDLRHYWQFDKHTKLVSRLVAGIGHAFGNSTTMPYIKQFSIGGSNSIRAFPARSVGPGTYNVRADTSAATNNGLFIDQRGDLKLEGNVEFRFDIIRSLKGALFMDAGNIWLLRLDTLRTGGEFHRKTFMKEIAVGTGFGLRFDFSFFVLRLDLAMPLRKPYLPDGQRWVIDKIDLGSSTWRKDNLIFNIAIGYPF